MGSGFHHTFKINRLLAKCMGQEARHYDFGVGHNRFQVLIEGAGRNYFAEGYSVCKTHSPYQHPDCSNRRKLGCRFIHCLLRNVKLRIRDQIDLEVFGRDPRDIALPVPSEEIVGQVELNPMGLALYRLDRNREISITEAQRLVEIGWGKPDVVRVFTPDGVLTGFEYISLTLEGALELADMD